MKFFKVFSLSLAILGAGALEAPAQSSERRTPVVVELFTSEGCSTCPPADKYLESLTQSQSLAKIEIIALSEHVDYWNRFGWTDPFSSAQFSKRQGYYAAFFKRDEIYTPQLIVDGTREIKVKQGDKSLAEAAAEPKADVAVKIEKSDAGVVSLKVDVADLPAIPGGDQAVVLLAVTEDDLTSNVLRGENGGRKLKHAAVTRYLKNIGAVAGRESSFSAAVELGKDWKRENLNAVAFVQQAASRKIIGAAKISLRN